jgi:DNA-binding YbaB/EbfC family protein
MSRQSGRGEEAIAAQLQQMQQRLEEAQKALEGEMVEVTTGGGAVRVKMSGTQRCHEVQLSPDLIESGDVDMLQDLILLAFNQAIHESQVVAARRLGPMASGMIPGAGASG